MVSYVEQPHRVKSARQTSKLFAALSLKAQSKSGSTIKREKDDDDPVKAMQNRMLHTALHDRSNTVYQPPVHHLNYSRSTRSTRPAQFSNVRPPRGTLSDDKLPYLDWRLSQLYLQQVQIEEEAERICRRPSYPNAFDHQAHQQISTSHAYDPIKTYGERSSSSSNAVPMRKQKSTISTSTGSDFGSDQSSGQGLDSLDYVDTTDSWHSSAHKHNDARTATYHQDMYSNTVLHETLLTDEALAAVPHLNDQSNFLSTDSINEEEEDDNEVNEMYFEAVDDTPAPPRSASLQYRSDLSEQTAPTTTRRLPKLFSRTPRRPAFTSRSLSHGNEPTSQATINMLYPEKTKKKWNLLALHNLGGSESMMRESDLLMV
jgi:hypothetical protein